MPKLARWAMRAAFIYLLLGAAGAVLYWTNVLWPWWPLLSAISPTYLHLIVVGWLTQMVFGVIYWMFPIISKAHPRGDERIGWATFTFLNTGLIARVICEPWRAMQPNSANAFGLLLSALLQVAAAAAFVWICWARVREHPGTS